MVHKTARLPAARGSILADLRTAAVQGSVLAVTREELISETPSNPLVAEDTEVEFLLAKDEDGGVCAYQARTAERLFMGAF